MTDVLAEQPRGANCIAFALAAGENDGGDRESFRQFVQEDSNENKHAEPGGNQEAGGNRHAVEERVNGHAEEHGAARVMAVHFFRVRLLSEMKVGSDGVFEKMNEKIADEHED